MKRIPASPKPVVSPAPAPGSSAADHARAAEALEQLMSSRGLSAADKRFLRTLHEAEKHLNDAFDEARQPGDLQQQVARVYRQLYRPD